MDRDDTDTGSTTETSTETWHATACVLCSINCGLEVRIDGPTITRVRGDKAHPGSQGYTCEKGLRIDHYQNGPHRLTFRCRQRRDASAGLHNKNRISAVAQPTHIGARPCCHSIRKLLKIALHQGLQIGVDHDRAGAFVFPKLGKNFVGE